jgi:hypothetical protein
MHKKPGRAVDANRASQPQSRASVPAPVRREEAVPSVARFAGPSPPRVRGIGKLQVSREIFPIGFPNRVIGFSDGAIDFIAF